MVGTWAYTNPQSHSKREYSVVHDGSQLLFQENRKVGCLVAGKDGWMVTNLKEGAKPAGTIRLKLVDEEMVSHFKRDDNDEWGLQISAQRLLAVEIEVPLYVAWCTDGGSCCVFACMFCLPCKPSLSCAHILIVL